MKQHIFLICLFFLSTTFCLAQSDAELAKQDSLLQLVETSVGKEKKMDSYFELINRLIFLQSSLADKHLENFLAWVNEENLPLGIAKAHILYGYKYYEAEEYEKALEYYQKAEEFGKENPIVHLKILNLQSDAYKGLRQTTKQDSLSEIAINVVQEIERNGSEASAVLAVYYRLKTHRMYRQNNEKDLEIALDSTDYFSLRANNKYLRTKILLRNSLYVRRNEPDRAMEMMLEARELSRADGIDHLFPGIPRTLSETYTFKGETEKALGYAFEAVEISEKSGKKINMVTAYYSLGALYQSLYDDEKTIEYLEKSIALSKEIGEQYYRSIALGTIGKTYLYAEDYEVAKPYFNEAIEYCENANIMIQLRGDLALAHIGGDSLVAAKELLERNLLSPALGTGYNKYFNDAIWAYWHMKSKSYRKAIEYGEPAHKYAIETDNLPMQTQVTEVLHKCYREIGQNELAYEAALTFFTLSDSLSKDNQLKKITTLELTSQFTKEKDALALQKERDEAVLKAETRQSQTLAGGIGLLALLGFGFFWNARRKNKTIALQNEQLNHLNQTKDRIFAILGHDMRKPVLSFRGIAEKVNYLLQTKDYDRLNKLGSQIEENALGLSKLTNNLLAWALTQRNVMPYNPEKVPLAIVAEEALEIFGSVVAEKNLSIRIDIPENLRVYADKNALLTIVRNLLDNAIKYTPIGGKIELTAESTENSIRLKVKDNGVGMTEEKVNDIFLLAENKSEPGTNGEKGTGLGLHLINELVQLNKGIIEVTSRVNEGTVFNLSLPSA